MAQSLSKIYIHLIFHIKKNSPVIEKEHKNDLCAYIGSVIKTNESVPIAINGTSDHLHILFVMSKNISLAKITEEIKRHSSRWIKTKDEKYINFAWQGGYGGFSVSQSIHDKTKKYIDNQEEHHKKTSYKDEVLRFLKEYGLDYNEDYFFED